jgi:predicted AAA+ superfamily ATPase
MKRDIYSKLQSWKTSTRRKPLILRGARQAGKTFVLKEFGRREYDNIVYCDFEADPKLAYLFDQDLDPQRIISELSIYLDQEIHPAHDLLIFDEIQASERALTSLKYFQEEAPEYHLIAAGSLLGVKVSGSFPVGKVSFLDLYPLTFLEFLDAMGANRYRTLINNVTSIKPLNEAFHKEILALLRQYHVIGGMPEVVRHFTNTGNARQAREIQLEIIDSYVLDFAKHASGQDISKLTIVWDSIPHHLARENKKFMFSAVRKGARAREYENALTWLDNAGLIRKCKAIENVKVPLKHYATHNCFKVYMLDVGLLGAMAKIPLKLLTQQEQLLSEYQGALVENYVAQQLVAHFQSDLYYWRSKGGKAELDFVFEWEGQSYPLEVKAGINPRSKSLRSYNEQYMPTVLMRTNLLNLKLDGKICNIPLYAIALLSKIATNLG